MCISASQAVRCISLRSLETVTHQWNRQGRKAVEICSLVPTEITNYNELYSKIKYVI